MSLRPNLVYTMSSRQLSEITLMPPPAPHFPTEYFEFCIFICHYIHYIHDRQGQADLHEFEPLLIYSEFQASWVYIMRLSQIKLNHKKQEKNLRHPGCEHPQKDQLKADTL